MERDAGAKTVASRVAIFYRWFPKGCKRLFDCEVVGWRRGKWTCRVHKID